MNKLENIDTEKRWKVKAHYVGGEFAGYVIVTDDKYEDVICHGLGVDQEVEADLIASAPELKAERDRMREALEKIAQWDMLARSQIGLIAIIEVLKDTARETLEGTGE